MLARLFMIIFFPSSLYLVPFTKLCRYHKSFYKTTSFYAECICIALSFIFKHRLIVTRLFWWRCCDCGVVRASWAKGTVIFPFPLHISQVMPYWWPQLYEFSVDLNGLGSGEWEQYSRCQCLICRHKRMHCLVWVLCSLEFIFK